MKENYIQWNIRLLKDSLKKININLPLIVGIDFLFYSFVSFVLAVIGSNLSKAYETIPAADIASQSKEMIFQAAASLKSFYYAMVFSVIVFVVVFIFASGIAKSIIWALTSGTKITIDYILKFSIMNSILVIIWSLLSVVFIIILNSQSAINFIFTLAFIFTYFGITAYALFTNSQKVSSLKQAIKLNIKKLHLLLLPYALIISVLTILSKTMLSIISINKFAYWNYVFVAITLMYLGIVRYYLLGLIININQTSN